ncbi:MAG: hypothetical protein ABI397_01135 [Candidatus Saccharimonas sp.]
MILITHIIIALASVTIASLGFFRPSNNLLNLSYGLIAATVGTGTYLIFAYPAHMLSSCTAGLAYVGVVSVLTYYAKRKLAAVTI